MRTPASSNFFPIQVHPRQPRNAPSSQPRPMIAVMPHHPSAVILYPADSQTPSSEITQPPFDSRMVALPDTRDETIGAAPRPSREQSEREPRHPAGQDVPPTTADIDGLQTHLQTSAVQRSPVARLPPELLTYIFELCVGRGSEPTHNLGPEHRPFFLAQVCKLWKAIVEADPHLWTSIYLYFSGAMCQDRIDDVSRVKPVLDLHLKRSGALPISLTFIDHRIYNSTTEGLIALLVDRLRMHAPRWQRISLHMACYYFPLLFTFTPCDLASLEHLAISGDLTSQWMSLFRLNLESAPNLKSFTYSGLGDIMDDQIDLRWENLAEVSFEFVPLIGASYTLYRKFRHLAQCQNITTFSLGIDQPFLLGQYNGQIITLPCLHTLRVRRLSPYSRAYTVIDPLILPQLEMLDIDAAFLIGWNQRWTNRTFSDLLARSKCTLRHLSIRDVDFPNDELLRCLTLSSGLTSLHFIPCPRSQDIRDVIRNLDVSRVHPNTSDAQGHQGRVAAGPLVPGLREVTLASSVEGYLDMMLEMIRSRVGAGAGAAGVAPLRRAEVVFFDLWHETDGGRVAGRGSTDRLRRVAGFRAGLSRCVLEDKKNEGGDEGGDLETSVVVDSPYLPEYINVGVGEPGPRPG